MSNSSFVTADGLEQPSEDCPGKGFNRYIDELIARHELECDFARWAGD